MANEKDARALIEVVKKVPIFNGLSPTQIKRILMGCLFRTFAESEVVSARGKPSDEMLVLLAGELSVNKQDGSVIAVLSPVTTVGEVSLIARLPHEMNVVATKSSSALAIARTKFDVLMREDVDMSLRIYRNIITLMASRFTGESVNSCDVEMLRTRNKLLEVRQRISLDMIADGGVSRQDAAQQIAERLRGVLPTILVVDDQEMIRTAFKRAFSNFNVMVASNGEEALKLAQDCRPDIVITDIHMDGMDGYQLLEQFRADYPEMPVLGISGQVDPGHGERQDFDGFLDKPVRIADMLKAVRQSLDPEESEQNTVTENAPA
jgi:CheY-like chemotaxis protein